MDDMYNEGQNHHATQGKLVLSAPPEGNGQPQSVSDQTSFMPSGSLQGSFMPGGMPPTAVGGPGYPPPAQPRKNIFQKLRSDPAYQVLAIAIVVVLIASSALVAFAASGMGSTNPNNNHANQQIAKVQTPHAQTPTAPVPTQMPTMAPTQTPIPVQQQPVQPPKNQGGNGNNNNNNNLTATFANQPAQLMNGGQGQISVLTQPGVLVQLNVTYGGQGFPVNMTQTAGADGMVNFTWTVRVLAANNVTATISAAALNNNNGQQVQVPPITVPVIVNGGK